jgi:CBS domain containing-hemolysin-like protein
MSLLEATILSVTPTYIHMAIQNKKPYGVTLQKLKAEIDRPLSAILTFNTVCHTLGAAGVGTQVLKMYGDSYVAIASVILTFVILIFTEIIPKTLGAVRWRSIAPIAAYAISFLIIVSYPIVKLSELISDLLGGGHIHRVTREEMILTAEMGASHGTLNKKETTIIKNLLMLENIFASDIMTPRSVIFTLPWDKTVGEVMTEFKPVRHSRIPIYSKDMDHIEGFVHRYKILEAFSQDRDSVQLKDMMLPIHSVPDTISVSAVLDQLIHRNEHVFVVVSEHGSTVGIVTLEDAIETLLGVEIVDEFDSVVDMRQYALDQWKKRKSAKTFA